MELTLLHTANEKIGYGRLGLKLNEALERAGVKCWRHLPTPEEAKVGQMTHLQTGREGKVCNVIAWISVPSHARGWWEGQVPIVNTMWESTYLPESFRESLDEFDTVIVPSLQNVELFSQYHKNVHYVPLGVSDEWHYQARKEPGVFFNFLIGGSGARKGTDLAFRAFQKVFPTGSWGDGPIPQLIMKNPKGEEELEGDRVVQITGHLSAEDEIALYADAHCYLQPSRGEGFGLQPLQAIAQGCPTILTSAHGHEAFAHLGYGLSSKLAQSEYFIYGEAGDWWEPNFDELCDRMRWVYDHYDEACDFAKGASWEATEVFTWDNCATQFLDAIGRDRLDIPYSGSGEWHWSTARLYKTVTFRDYYCEVNGIDRMFEAGKEYHEPADIKRILFEYGVLDPSCCQIADPDHGLLPVQVDRLGVLQAKQSICPTCNQQLNSQPKAWEVDLERRERKLELVR